MQPRIEMEYIKSLMECPNIGHEHLASINHLRDKFSEDTMLSIDEKECCFDLIDSYTIITQMLIPFQQLIGVITKYRGISLFNFNHTFTCEPISSLDLFYFISDQSENDRKTLINKLTLDNNVRDTLNLTVNTQKPKQFLKAISNATIDNNALRGIDVLRYGRQLTFMSAGIDQTECNIESAVRYIFSFYEQILMDLAHTSAEEDDAILIESVVTILKNANLKEQDLKPRIRIINNLRERIYPTSFRKICRYILYTYVLGFYVSFDQTRFKTQELSIISHILTRNQFRNYGDIIRRKCRIKLSDLEASYKYSNDLNSICRKKPMLREAINNVTPFIEASRESDKAGQIKSETFDCSMKEPDRNKLQMCISILAEWGYIDNDQESKRILYYRITGCARPEVLHKIKWHKDVRALYLMLKTVLDKRKGKYRRIQDFIDMVDPKPQWNGKESSFADRVGDENVKDLFNYLYGLKLK